MADEQAKKTIAEREEEILAFWREHKIFEKSLEQTKNKEEFVFYDGPPFATGLPHYGHILASVLKDVIPRYQTMRGRYVPRRWGWDCHGLPLENIIEQELGFTHKKEIEEYGIAKFNRRAEETVLRYADDWRRIIPRIGRWVDMENDYRTMDPTYTESVWWIFKTLYDKQLIYEGYKSMHLCPRCETTLANFEVSQGYKDITDISVTVQFELADEKGAFVLAWTTTPWTLPGNVALAVHPDIIYAKVQRRADVATSEYGTDHANDDPVFYLAKDLIKDVIEGEYEIIDEVPGAQLVGRAYKPVFDYYIKQKDLPDGENGWKIYAGDFVTTNEGTGVVHIAPAFGDEDMQLGKKHHLPFVQHVKGDGSFVDDIRDFAGLPVKPKDDHQKTDIEIIKHLAHTGVLFAKKKITHSYPFCWRCDTPLLNYAANSWFVNVPSIRENLIAANKDIVWSPEHLKEGRFGRGLETAPDWSISRSRYWGAPLPVWRCEKCKDIHVVGSLVELEERRITKANTFFVLRHGERNDLDGSGNGISDVKYVKITHDPEAPIHMTDKGKNDISNIARQLLKDGGVDVIYASDFVRTRETAEIVAHITGAKIVYDERLRELRHGTEFEGKEVREYLAYFGNDHHNRIANAPKGGESLHDVQERMVNAVRDIDKKHEGKRILIVSHGDPLWVLEASMDYVLPERALDKWLGERRHYIKQGELRPLHVRNFPYDERGWLNMHRPFVDDIVLACSCGGVMKRIPEVFDCWFESGSMPYGQQHYPFENTDIFDPKNNKGYPAHYIAEGLDQTRGWFYSLHVLATALFEKPAYKQVLVNGTILAEDGQKMSKRLKNYPDPMEVISRYGADALRLYFLMSPAVSAEDLHFSEKGVDETAKKVIARLVNMVSFYNLYRTHTVKEPLFDMNAHVLDQYLVYNLMQTEKNVMHAMEQYRLDRAVRLLADFVDMFSTIYLQYSRDRFREGAEERVCALEYFHYALLVFAKILAPFAPFAAEYIYQDIKDENGKESVHLEEWPSAVPGEKYEKTNQEMKITRSAIEHILASRSMAGISVRQPLSKATVRELPEEESFRAIIRERTNIESLAEHIEMTEDCVLDTELTDNLRMKGLWREVMRDIQDLRKREGMQPNDAIHIVLYADAEMEALTRGVDDIAKAVGAHTVSFAEHADGMQELRTKGVYVRIEKE
ncbi:MAG: hypothetical protein COU90_00640 [Candidatus Ryanbacteria bacterium CG10_big_fil_rev_8_21_14_0_10_43_42]|uniref:isoleucine--tRNA ligase n=1 Tax=Candidatus Ryanbacteria bacterium CG10_big_fil_rev_8_21_14_0_10_43_42 TaxID=1974864 RepID=A0A2M8KXZ6_9BACT|nr:MAG: hypothetical protein COU90_00640 [Candidatus Ryanbacteria bacterium CG10_big_fil_rev_8_21_14_0_10_43_42]